MHLIDVQATATEGRYIDIMFQNTHIIAGPINLTDLCKVSIHQNGDESDIFNYCTRCASASGSPTYIGELRLFPAAVALADAMSLSYRCISPGAFVELHVLYSNVAVHPAARGTCRRQCSFSASKPRSM